MTVNEYHARYGITPADLRRWIKAYRKQPAMREQVGRWERTSAELEMEQKTIDNYPAF